MDLRAVPWATLAPNEALLAWLVREPRTRATALVVGCGYGDDAEALAERGCRVTAFDVSATAIARCHSRFPETRVEYVVADVLAPPVAWRAAFELVVEIRTIQSLPPSDHAAAIAAIAAIASTVAQGGRLFVRCLAGAEDPHARRPWPVTDDELDGFERAGLGGLYCNTEPFVGPVGSSAYVELLTAVYARG
jgi:SAM-dependent methyltransferase